MFIHDQINEKAGETPFWDWLCQSRAKARSDWLGYAFSGEGRDFALMWCAA